MHLCKDAGLVKEVYRNLNYIFVHFHLRDLTVDPISNDIGRCHCVLQKNSGRCWFHLLTCLAGNFVFGQIHQLLQVLRWY